MSAIDATHYAVLGAGHGGQALAGYLSLKGFKVNLYNRTPERLNSIKLMGGIQVEGEIQDLLHLMLLLQTLKKQSKMLKLLWLLFRQPVSASWRKISFPISRMVKL